MADVYELFKMYNALNYQRYIAALREAHRQEARRQSAPVARLALVRDAEQPAEKSEETPPTLAKIIPFRRSERATKP